MAPVHPSYAPAAAYQMAPQGDGAYGSLNDALRSPTVYQPGGSQGPSSKAKKRDSGMLGFALGGAGVVKKGSMGRLREREEEGGRF